LQYAPDLDARRLGGSIWGLDGPMHDVDGSPDIDGSRGMDRDFAPAAGGMSLRAALFHGGNLIPVGRDLEALELLAEQLSRNGRGCSSIVGPAASVQAIWPVLARRWGPARAIRMSQPLLMIDRAAAANMEYLADRSVRIVHPTEEQQFLPAAVAMFTEELGMSPLGPDRGAGYRARVGEVIAARRAFARFDDRGQVEFKAEIGALSAGTAQLQGVWVRPDLRGRGIGTAAMAAVLRLALDRAPTVSLYVNDFNTPARRMYDRLGMRQAGVLRTVLF
jgi:predicted GNAT family acetyltransferase